MHIGIACTKAMQGSKLCDFHIAVSWMMLQLNAPIDRSTCGQTSLYLSTPVMNPASAMAACRGPHQVEKGRAGQGRAGQGRAGQGKLPFSKKGKTGKLFLLQRPGLGRGNLQFQ